MDRRALAGLALEAQPAAMPLDDMLDDRQPQAGPAERPAAARVDSIETLGDPRDMLGRDAFAAVGEGEVDHVALAGQADGHRRSAAAVAQSIADEIVEQL